MLPLAPVAGNMDMGRCGRNPNGESRAGLAALNRQASSRPILHKITRGFALRIATLPAK
jgi:hypothetical protein